MNKERESGLPFPVPQDSPFDPELHETITMYSRPTSFGPAVAGSDVIYEYPTMSTSGTMRWQNSDSLYGKNPAFTPPYYDGECWYDIVFATTESVTLTLDELFQAAGTRQHRIWKLEESAWPTNEPTFTPTSYGEDFPMAFKNANRYSMKMSS